MKFYLKEVNEMKDNIESVTKVLNNHQIMLFKERKCQFCTNYSSIGICAFDEYDVNSCIIKCIEEDLFRVKIDIVRAE